MISLSLFLLLISAVAGCLMVTVLRKRNVPPADRDWMDSFSVAKYRPMERLLSEEDFAFLASQPGYRPAISRKLRKERQRIFGSYLRCMVRDFEMLYAAGVHSTILSSEDRAEFSSALFRQKLIFEAAVLGVRGRLLLYTLGIGTVNVSGLLNAIGSLSGEVKRLQPAIDRF